MDIRSTNMITVHEIELFLAVAHAGSILSASQQMFISQPTLSGTIRSLEVKLGYKLFQRTNHGVILTEQGMELYTALHNIYHKFRVHMNNALNDRLVNRAQNLRIGGLHMNEIVQAMQNICNAYAEQPQSKGVSLEYYNYYELYSMLVCRELDAILTLSFEVENRPGLESIRLFPIDLRFVFPAEWNIHELNEDTCRFLTGKPLLCEMHMGRKLFQEYCRTNGFESGELVRVGSFLEMIHQVSVGKGFTLWGNTLPALIAERGGITTVDAKMPKTSEPVYASIAWRKGETDPEILRFADSIRLIDFNMAVSKPIYRPDTDW